MDINIELSGSANCQRPVENETLIGKIINVSADEKILTDGKIDSAKLQALAFDPANGDYLLIGDKVGKAFQDYKKLK